jgi:ribosomal protein S18 acetylase RimI-like enzyme
MDFRALSDSDFDSVFTAFSEAFSDYVIKLSPTREQLQEMLTRRGYVPAASVGVFDGDRLVAFTLNGVDGPAAYDSGTGVVPSHRRRGLARQMLDYLVPRLREQGCTRYVLEVLEANEAARALYRGFGFVETRGLQCWTWSGAGASDRPRPQAGQRPAKHLLDFDREAFDVQPSWQNSTASLQRARDSYVVLGDDDGFAVVFPSTGDLPQLAVRREARRHGIGTRLLHEAAAVAGKPLRIINVDDRDVGIAAFLGAAGAQKSVRQLEMELAL